MHSHNEKLPRQGWYYIYILERMFISCSQRAACDWRERIMPRRTKEAALETRAVILDTAERVFYDKGVSRTSLADIAAAAGLTRGAIYWHFKNKCDLFTAMFDRVLLPLDELMANLPGRDRDPLGVMRDTLINCMQDVSTDERRRRVFIILFHKCEISNELGPLFDRHRQNLERSRQEIEANFNQAIAQKQLPARLDARRAAVLLHAQLVGLLSDWLFSPDTFDLGRYAQSLVDAFIDMLRLSPALQLAPASHAA